MKTDLQHERSISSSADWPIVSVIVPVAGAENDMAACLRSVLVQDYPSYEVVFVTRQQNEKAASIIRKLIEEKGARGYCDCRHIASGDATVCGQKNFNLLAGIATVSREREVFAFFDASHVAPVDWLKRLIGPIACNEVPVTTGYHHVLPEYHSLAAVGRAITVSIIHLLHKISFLSQPWGGNTAIRRSVFEALDIKEIWETNVVDDVSLAAQLKKTGTRLRSIPGACLSTPLAHESLKGWSDWFTRQLLYLKFCFPGSWVLSGFGLFLLAALLLSATACCLAAVIGGDPLETALPAGLFLLVFSIVAEIFRKNHPHPGPFVMWHGAFFVMVVMGCFCHLRSWFSRAIRWRGICYNVTWGGRVLYITGNGSRISQ
jgi:ceramide glucosyltransferase